MHRGRGSQESTRRSPRPRRNHRKTRNDEQPLHDPIPKLVPGEYSFQKGPARATTHRIIKFNKSDLTVLCYLCVMIWMLMDVV